MAGMLLGGIPFLQRIVPDRWRAAGIFCLISAGLLAGLYRLPPSGGRPSLMKAIVFDSGDLDFYHDATVWDRVPPGAGALLRAIGVNTVNNISRLNDVFRSEPRGLEPAGLFAIVAAVIVSLGIGLWRRDVLIFGCGMLGFAVLVLVVTIYRTPNFGGLRHLLFTWPLLAVALGASLAGLLGRGTSVLRGLMSLILLAGLVGGSMFLACRGVRSIAAYDAADDQAVALLESTEHDRQRLIASPYWMGLPYAASNHPVKWAFLPANVQTLSLLMDKYDVGTLIVPHNVTSLESGRILEAGFTLDREIDWPPYRLRVFKAPPKPERRSSATLPSSRRE
jgi:hypothetical protein